MPTLNKPTAHNHHSPDPMRSGLSFDPVTVVAAAVMSILLLIGVIACFSFMLHTGTTSSDHHYQCVDSSGQPSDSSECSRGGDIPFIPAPVIVP